MIALTDYKVKFRDEPFIAHAALVCRTIGTRPGQRYVDLQVILDDLQAHGVVSIFSIRGLKKKGRLIREIVDDDRLKTEAEVQFDPRLILKFEKASGKDFRKAEAKSVRSLPMNSATYFYMMATLSPFPKTVRIS
jgi:hypothetical protein